MYKSALFIKEQRIKRGLTQKELAKRFKWGLQYVSNIERSKCLMPLDKVKKMSRLLGVYELSLANVVLKDIIADAEKKMGV